jgi:hypothetical protein
MTEIIVTVRDKNNTYTAKFGAHSASCTGGAEQAARRLAEKIFGALQQVDVVFLERIGLGQEEWSIRPDLSQRCRVCGCTWEKACRPDGCHWVERDLCSCCVESPVRSGLDRTTSGALGQP